MGRGIALQANILCMCTQSTQGGTLKSTVIERESDYFHLVFLCLVHGGHRPTRVEIVEHYSIKGRWCHTYTHKHIQPFTLSLSPRVHCFCRFFGLPQDPTHSTAKMSEHVDEAKYTGFSKYYNSYTRTGRIGASILTIGATTVLVLALVLKPKKK